MSTPTATKPADLAQLTAAAEKARDQAAEASAKASAAMAQAQLAAERIHAERDVRFVRWAEHRLGESNATLATLAAEVDTARLAFDASVADGDPAFVARYLDWATAGAALFHTRNHTNNLRNHLHRRRPDQHAAYDAGRSVNDSRTTIPSFAEALDRSVAHAAAARGGDVEDQLQRELESALRGEDPAAPDGRDG